MKINTQHCTSKFLICFNSSAARFLILLILFFVQYAATAASLVEIIENAGINIADHRNLINHYFNNFYNSILNSITERLSNPASAPERWAKFGESRIEEFLAPPGITRQYNMQTSTIPPANADIALYVSKIAPNVKPNEKDAIKLLVHPNLIYAENQNNLMKNILNSYKAMQSTHPNNTTTLEEYEIKFFTEMTSGFIYSNLDRQIKADIENNMHNVPSQKRLFNVFNQGKTETPPQNLDYRLSILEYEALYNTLKLVSHDARDDQILNAIDHYFNVSEQFLTQWAQLEVVGINVGHRLTAAELKRLADRHPNILTSDVMNRILYRRQVISLLDGSTRLPSHN